MQSLGLEVGVYNIFRDRNINEMVNDKCCIPLVDSAIHVWMEGMLIDGRKFDDIFYACCRWLL